MSDRDGTVHEWLARSLEVERDRATLDANLTALVRMQAKDDGNTPAVVLACGDHSTGWVAFMTVRGDLVEARYLRESDEVAEGSCTVRVLVGHEAAGSLRVTCHGCGREYRMPEVHLFPLMARALLAKTRRGSRKFVRLDRMP